MGETQDGALAAPFGSFAQIIGSNAAALGDQIALRDDTGELSWAALGDRVERLAARLVADGLEREQEVRGKVITALVYPAALAIVATVLLAFVGAAALIVARAHLLQ